MVYSSTECGTRPGGKRFKIPLPSAQALGKADKVVIRESQLNNMAGKMGCKTRKMVIPYVIINTADHIVSGWPVHSHAKKGKNM
jgi:hypothetical protein